MFLGVLGMSVRPTSDWYRSLALSSWFIKVRLTHHHLYHCLTGEAGPCGLNPVWCASAPTPTDTPSAMPWWSKGRTVGFDFFGLLWARGRRCSASIRDCTDYVLVTFWGADCAWKVDIPHIGLIRWCPGPGGPRGRSPPAFRCVYTNRSMGSSQ